MELVLLWLLLNVLVRVMPERKEPPHLSRWDALMLQMRREREQAEANEPPSLPGPK